MGEEKNKIYPCDGITSVVKTYIYHYGYISKIQWFMGEKRYKTVCIMPRIQILRFTIVVSTREAERELWRHIKGASSLVTVFYFFYNIKTKAKITKCQIVLVWVIGT